SGCVGGRCRPSRRAPVLKEGSCLPFLHICCATIGPLHTMRWWCGLLLRPPFASRSPVSGGQAPRAEATHGAASPSSVVEMAGPMSPLDRRRGRGGPHSEDGRACHPRGLSSRTRRGASTPCLTGVGGCHRVHHAAGVYRWP